MRRHNVTEVVRVCKPTYNEKRLLDMGINVHVLCFFIRLIQTCFAKVVKNWPFVDGEAPPPLVVREWLDLIQRRFFSDPAPSSCTIAVHCVAGLGRFGCSR